MSEGTSPRRRGLRLLLLAILLIGAVLGLLAGMRPDAGEYTGWVHIVVHLLWVLACTCFGFGGFHAVVGAPGGGPGVLRTLVGIAFGVTSIGALAVGGFVLHAAMSYDGDRSERTGHSDFDWD
ncbi:MAG: hypothetical protein IAG13_12800 [Deltaproteobacteria bacterium]|nr:hypothetical protein [Nannocystaceae bacterium]